jgi:hypothetical protein
VTDDFQTRRQVMAAGTTELIDALMNTESAAS